MEAAATLEAAPTEETFESIIAKFPYAPSSDEGKGFLPVLARSIGHLLYLVGRYDDTAKTKPTQARAKEEVDSAINHWNNLIIDASLSNRAKDEIALIDSALRLTANQIEGWTEKESLDNLQKVTNRVAQLLANLDREILGIRESDAGFNL